MLRRMKSICPTDSITDVCLKASETAKQKGVDGVGVFLLSAYKLERYSARKVNRSAKRCRVLRTRHTSTWIVVLKSPYRRMQSITTWRVLTSERLKLGDVLTFDGIKKRFLKNGAPTTAKEWISFPRVLSVV